MFDRIVNSAQKEAMLHFMEKHSEFAKGRVDSPQAAKLNERLWAKLTSLLNSMRGPSKNAKGWKEQWSLIRSAAKQAAFSNGKPKNTPTGGGGPDEDFGEGKFTTDDPFIDRVMDLQGWHLAFGVGIADELESYLTEDKATSVPASSRQSAVTENYSTSSSRNQQSSFNQLMLLVERQSEAIAQLRSVFDKFN